MCLGEKGIRSKGVRLRARDDFMGVTVAVGPLKLVDFNGRLADSLIYTYIHICLYICI
jgi:hypothetical protein